MGGGQGRPSGLVADEEDLDPGAVLERTRHPELADIPTAVDLGRNDDEKQVLSTIMAAADIGSAFFTTPGVPPDRLNALRRAFDATMQDKEFLADVEKTKLTISPMKGEDLQTARQEGERPAAGAA